MLRIYQLLILDDSGCFSVMDDLSLIRKDSITHMHFLAV